MISFIIFIPVSVFFILNGCFHLYYAIKLYKRYPKEHNLINSILICCLWVISGFVYPFYFPLDNNNYNLFGTLSSILICIVTPFILFLILFYQYKFIIKKKPQMRVERTIENLIENFQKSNKQGDELNCLPLRVDIKRKLLHLFPAGVIICLWIFAVWIWAGIWNSDVIWKISGLEFANFLIITVGFSGVLVFATLDYIRLSYIFEEFNLFYLIPTNVMELLSKSMKKNELYEFTKPVAMVLALAPIYFFDFSIFVSTALIATLGDGAASIMGLKFGRYNFPKKSNKTIIGYISGFFVSFWMSIIVFMIFNNSLHFLHVLFISLVGASTFLVIDLLNLNIDDNILNPLFCGGLMALIFYLI